MSTDILPRLRHEPGDNSHSADGKSHTAPVAAPAPAAAAPATNPERGWLRDNAILMVAIGCIIVALITVIAWLANKLIEYKSRSPSPAPPPPRYNHGPAPKPRAAATTRTASHSDVVDTASDDELAKYAQGGTKPTSSAEPDVPPTKVRFPEPPATVVDESKAAKQPPPANAKPPMTTADSVSVVATVVADALKTNDSKDGKDVIRNLVESEAQKIENKEFVPVEQLSKSGEITVVKRFTSKADLIAANFDHDAIVQCCNGEQPLHAGFRWRTAH